MKSHTETEPLSLEPYAIAYRMAHEQGVSRKDIEAAVARGREIQVEAARDSLRSLADRVTALGHPGVSVALLVNRATWMTDLVEYSLGWPDHVPVAENLAVREALRTAAARNGLALIEYDEKSLPSQAAETLGLKAEDLDSELKALGVAAGKPWRKEQKLACLAAWLAA
ncbi:MAG: hypothetical protein ACXU8O_06710, partial [Asticcacaulis sp.]